MTAAKLGVIKWQARNALLREVASACGREFVDLLCRCVAESKLEENSDDVVSAWLESRRLLAPWLVSRIVGVAARVSEGADPSSSDFASDVLDQSQWMDSELEVEYLPREAAALADSRAWHQNREQFAGLKDELARIRAEVPTVERLKRIEAVKRQQTALVAATNKANRARQFLAPIEANPAQQTLKQFEVLAREHFRARSRVFRDAGLAPFRQRRDLQSAARAFVMFQLGAGHAESIGQITREDDQGRIVRKSSRQRLKVTIDRFGALVGIAPRAGRTGRRPGRANI